MGYKSPLSVYLPEFKNKVYGSNGSYANPKTVVDDSNIQAETISSMSGGASDAMHSVEVGKNSKTNNESSNPAAEARRKGRQDRKLERQTQRAKRITARNDQRLEKTKQRQEHKNNRFDQRNPESPLEFGLGAALGAAVGGSSSGVERLQSILAQEAAASQSGAMPADPSLAAAGITPTPPPVTGGATDVKANPFGDQKYQLTPVQMTYEPTTPANMKGNAKPVFSPQVQASAEYIYGTPLQRQMSVPGAPVFFKDQTGDGKITRADVIKARVEGYKK